LAGYGRLFGGFGWVRSRLTQSWIWIGSIHGFGWIGLGLETWTTVQILVDRLVGLGLKWVRNICVHLGWIGSWAGSISWQWVWLGRVRVDPELDVDWINP